MLIFRMEPLTGQNSFALLGSWESRGFATFRESVALSF